MSSEQWDEYKDKLREDAKKFTPVGEMYLKSYSRKRVDERTVYLIKSK